MVSTLPSKTIDKYSDKKETEKEFGHFFSVSYNKVPDLSYQDIGRKTEFLNNKERLLQKYVVILHLLVESATSFNISKTR